MKNVLLALGAHPADMVTGCAGTIANHLQSNDEVYVGSLTHGVFSHFRNDDLLESESNIDDAIKQLKDIKRNEKRKAAKALGVKDENLLFFEYDDEPLFPEKCIVYDVANQIRKIQPNIVVLHHPAERDHDDHQSAGEIGLRSIKAAANYVPNCKYPKHIVKNIYFMLPQYLERHFSTGHILQAPDIIINIEDVIDLKIEATSKFTSQKYTIESSRKTWESISGRTGIFHGFKYAEAFISMNPQTSKCLPSSYKTSIHDLNAVAYLESKKMRNVS